MANSTTDRAGTWHQVVGRLRDASEAASGFPTSVGIVSHPDLDASLSEADHAMYEDKRWREAPRQPSGV